MPQTASQKADCASGPVSNSWAVLRHSPRTCVSSPSPACRCTELEPPPKFPCMEFPQPPSCPGYCICLIIIFLLILVILIILCILACVIGDDEKPKPQDKSTTMQKLSHLFKLLLFKIRCLFKCIFGDPCPNKWGLGICGCFSVIWNHINCWCRESKKENDSENTERTSDQTITPTHYPTNASLKSGEVHLDTLSTPRGQNTDTRVNGIKMDQVAGTKTSYTNHNDESACVNEVKLSNSDTSAKSKQVQLEAAKDPSSASIRTRRVAPTTQEDHGKDSPTPV